MAGSERREAVWMPGRWERRLRVAALACSAAALVLLVAYWLSWRLMGPPASAVLPPAGEVLDGKAPFRFGVVGDSHSNLDVLEAVLSSMKADGVSLVLHTGDMVQKCAGVDFDWLLQELGEARVGVPFCAVPGNHDTVEGESDPQARCRLYNRSFGPRQYWFAYANALFVGFDASLKAYGEADLRWLDQTLSRLRDRFGACIVYTHIPPHDPRSGRNHDSEQGADALGRILKKHRVSALFCGHIHSYLETTLDGVPVYISGGGGAELYDPLGPFHYLLCTVEPGGRLRVEKKPVVAASREDYWEHLLLVAWPRRLGVGWVLALMAAGVLFSVLAGLAHRRRLRRAQATERSGPPPSA